MPALKRSSQKPSFHRAPPQRPRAVMITEMIYSFLIQWSCAALFFSFLSYSFFLSFSFFFTRRYTAGDDPSRYCLYLFADCRHKTERDGKLISNEEIQVALAGPSRWSARWSSAVEKSNKVASKIGENFQRSPMAGSRDYVTDHYNQPAFVGEKERRRWRAFTRWILLAIGDFLATRVDFLEDRRRAGELSGDRDPSKRA